MGIGFLAQIDTDVLRRLVEYSENASIERQALLIVLGLVVIGMPILFILTRGAVKQNSGILEVIRIQSQMAKDEAEERRRSNIAQTEALGRQANVMSEMLDAIRVLKTTQDLNNSAILRVEEGVDRGHVAIDGRLQELLRLLNSTAEDTRRVFVQANETFDDVRSEIKRLTDLQQQNAESGAERFRTYEANNGKQAKMLNDMTQALQAVQGTLTALKSDVAHIRDKRDTGEIQTINLTEENNGS